LLECDLRTAEPSAIAGNEYPLHRGLSVLVALRQKTAPTLVELVGTSQRTGDVCRRHQAISGTDNIDYEITFRARHRAAYSIYARGDSPLDPLIAFGSNNSTFVYHRDAGSEQTGKITESVPHEARRVRAGVGQCREPTETRTWGSLDHRNRLDAGA